jgi:hypothetical protein
MLALVGVTVIDTKLGAVTVKVAVPFTPCKVAAIVALPRVREVATPLLPAAFDTWATATSFDDQVTWVVMSRVVELSYFPVAVNACVWPALTVAVAGVTAIESSLASATETLVDPLIPDRVAVTVVPPTFTPVT